MSKEREHDIEKAASHAGAMTGLVARLHDEIDELRSKLDASRALVEDFRSFRDEVYRQGQRLNETHGLVVLHDHEALERRLKARIDGIYEHRKVDRQYLARCACVNCMGANRVLAGVLQAILDAKGRFDDLLKNPVFEIL